MVDNERVPELGKLVSRCAMCCASEFCNFTGFSLNVNLSREATHIRCLLIQYKECLPGFLNLWFFGIVQCRLIALWPFHGLVLSGQLTVCDAMSRRGGILVRACSSWRRCSFGQQWQRRRDDTAAAVWALVQINLIDVIVSGDVFQKSASPAKAAQRTAHSADKTPDVCKAETIPESPLHQLLLL